ncbi:MAG: DUF2520 domain-containing protein [Duncaniella sp.]|nr:DUF2520 domain-containing protein [Duncaniella sp.]
MVKISLIGSGNVATHLGQALSCVKGCEIVDVCSPHNSGTLAERLNARPVTRPSDVNPRSDLYLISVADDALPEVVRQLPENPDAIYAHTSGSVAIDVLKGLSDKIGVFYPLQTFSKDVDVDMTRVPLFIEGSDEATTVLLLDLASEISGKVFRADSRLRGRLHIAAVFACNFVNHLWSIADELLGQDGLSLEVLYPLLEETLRKAETNRPKDVQTGPAARRDHNIINKHAETLPPELKEIYLLLSGSIIRSQDEPNQL